MPRPKDVSNPSPVTISGGGTIGTVSRGGGGGSGRGGFGPTSPATSLATTGGTSPGDGPPRVPDPVVPDTPVVPGTPGDTYDPIEAAYQRALGYGRQQVTDRGLNQGLVDQYGLMDAYTALLNQQRGAITTDNANPYLAFGAENNFNNALDAGQTRYRTDLRNSITSQFGDGFEYGAFADTADDPLLQTILDQQRGDASLVLDRAKARGQLNDVGYGRAVTDLNSQGTAGLGNLQNIGGGVLSGYRQQLTGARDQGLTNAGTASFNTPFNATSVVDRLNSLRTDLSGRLAGDIQSGVGGTSFFTPNTAIGHGGTVQGTINPSKINFKDNPLLGAFQTEADRRQYGNNNGSLASTGAF